MRLHGRAVRKVLSQMGVTEALPCTGVFGASITAMLHIYGLS